MVQGYYTLQEAAQHLNIAVDELKQMAQKSRIRSFQDRGTLRFRIQDIQELARQRGVSSDPDLVLGEASLPPKKGDGPRSPKTAPPPAGPKTPPRAEVPEVFDFEFDDSATMDLGADLLPPESGAKKPSAAGKPKSGLSPKSGISPRSANVPQSKVGPKSPGQPKSGAQPRSGLTPKGGGQPKSAKKSDSDVKLVGGSDDVLLTLAPDSDIKLREKGSGPKTPGGSGMSPKPAAKSGPTLTPSPTSKRPSQLSPRSPQPADSGVRLVPMDSDSDVKIVKADDEVPLGESPAGANVDSNVRLEKVSLPPQPEDAGTMLTDEINLDEELKKEEERLKNLQGRPSKVKLKSELRFPTTSPFELSDSDVDGPTAQQVGQAAGAAPPKGSDSSDFDLAAAPQEGSSDFDLAAAKDSSSNFDLAAAASESNFDLAALKEEGPGPGGSDDDFSLELSDDDANLGGGEMSAPASGISLGNPIDAGISLEDKNSEDSLEFDLSLEPEATPRPAQMKELEGDEGSSEFELSLELGEAGGVGADSDSEFELTLDDSDAGNVHGDAPQIKAGAEEETQDIFESDFDIPALQAEGDGSEPATVDTETESSDFDLALDDSELAADEESGSQVVALDEEEVEPVADGDEIEVTDVEEGEFGGLEGDEVEVEEEEDTRPARVEVREKLLRPAPWGALPAIVMFPCVVVMLLVGLVGFEVVQSSVGHRPPGLMTRALNDGLLQPIGLSSVKLDKR